jgi:hypothetical protein
MSFNPRPKTQLLLQKALAHRHSVPYTPSPRWLSYRLLQDGLLDAKERFKTFDGVTAKARKAFYGHAKGKKAHEFWHPLTLRDSVRSLDDRGQGHLTLKPFIKEKIDDQVPVEFAHFQDNYVEVWFEAGAMHEQFEHILEEYGIPMLAFRGDTSIPIKYESAIRIEERSKELNKPAVILYFGDCDTKGRQIPKSALRDVRAWCDVDFSFVHCGLTLDQAREMNLPTNPDKPDQYQWEAMSDEQARALVLANVHKYWTLQGVEQAKALQNTLTEQWKKQLNK